jgi:hypothetical protein
MSTINFVNTTPEELVQLFSKSVKSEIEQQLKGISQKPEQEEHLTTNEALEILKVKAPTLWKYVKDGKITKYDFQGRVFYSRKELMNRFNKSV